MIGEQSRQELIDLKLLLKKCFLAECELGNFLLDKANMRTFSIDDHFKLKDLVDRVNTLIHEIEASDERPPPDKLPVYLQGGVPLELQRLRPKPR